MSDNSSVAPGWYPAPHANNEQRYWDGTRWHDSAPIAGAAVLTADTPGVSPHLPQSPNEPQKRNVLALISLIVAGVGFLFACIPGALIVGWVLLPIGFVLSLVSLFMKGKGKGLGIAGLIVSIVGTIVGFVVFFAVVANAVDEAFDETPTVVAEQSDSSTDEEPADVEEEPAEAPVEGTREQPYALGTTVTSDEWEVTINSVTLAANDAVAAANQFNDVPEAGHEYILVNATVTYVGSDEEGGFPAMVGIEYVTPTGETADTTFAVAPEPLDSLSTLYNGGTTSGNVVIEVPSENAGAGVIAVRPGMLVDTVFFAVQ